jgi:hypothetical protein
VVFNQKETKMSTRVNVERWRGHIEAAREAGMSLAQYARAHALSRHTLYLASQQMRREAPASVKRRPTKNPPKPKPLARAGAFVALRVAAQAIALRARLPNGVAVEFTCLAPGSYPAVLSALAGLPCSN